MASKGAEMSIEDLFDEVLLEIFSCLRLEDLVHSVQYVCTHWREVSHASRLWKALQYRPGYDDPDEDILAILQKAPKLQTILLDRVVVGSDVLETLATNCTRIKRLELGQYQDVNRNVLKILQKRCPHLEHLTIQERIIHDPEKAVVVASFCNLKTLIVVEDLDFPSEPVQLRAIADGCPSLEHVDLRSKIARIEDIEYLLFKKKHNLRVLGMTCWSEDGFCTLPLLSVCTVLNTLRIDHVCQVNLDGGLNTLTNCKTLTCLSWTYLGSTDLNFILSVFHHRSLDQLVELNISRYVNYDDKLANVIVKTCPKLKKLHLPECWTLTDASLRNLHNLRHLQSVDFCGSNITDVGVTYLSHCRRLQYLDLSCCERLTGHGMHMMTFFSDLKVLILDGCDVQGIPLDLIPLQLKSLSRLSICCCYGVNRDALRRLRSQMPLLSIAQ